MSDDLSRQQLSNRGLAPLQGGGMPPYLVEHFQRVEAPYHPDDRPDGYIPLCVAENKLMWDVIGPRARAPREVPASAFGYDDMIGSAVFREQIARFAERTFLGRRFATDQVIALAGAGSVLEMLFYVLAYAGEAVLVPTPSYAGFWMDLETRDELHIVPVHTRSDDDFRLTIDALDAALTSSDRPVRALLFTSPNNPLGTVYSAEEIEEVVRWCEDRRLHLIMDEVYALSVHGEQPFQSVASVRSSLGERVHVVWAFSKDMAASGLRCGVLFSENRGVLDAVGALSYWAAVSGDTQHFLAELIADDALTGNYLQLMRERLARAYAGVTERLEHHGIPFVPAEAGFFLLVDVRQHLPERTWTAEEALWRRLLDEANVNLTPGTSLHNGEPGFLRLCFAGIDADTARTGVDRLARVLGR